MNVLFLTQGSSLSMFYELMKALRGPLQLERVGFYVASYAFFQQFCQLEPDIESGKYTILKEWEVTAKARKGKADLDVIRQYEQRLGDPHLWGVLVADRRVHMGEKCSFFQDYRPRFKHVEMLNILQEGLVCMERLFDEVQPDAVISFICVTFGEYLAYLFAKRRGIPFLNLRPTRIHNYMTFGSDIFEPSTRVLQAYQWYLNGQAKDDWLKEAKAYVDAVRTKDAKYEGVIAPTRVPSAGEFSMYRLPSRLMKLLRKTYEHRFGAVRDNHDLDPLTFTFYKRFWNPLRARWNHRRLLAGYVTEAELPSLNYTFFALHTEPEVSLQVYSKPFQNQVDVIRNLSQSVPVGMKVVVKEHPVAVGKRPLSYYRKILELPNVLLADPALSTKSLVEHARLVATIAGATGWEGILRQRPVVFLGHTPWEFLPNSLARRVTDLEQLGDEIDDLIKNYAYQERVVLAFVAAIMSQSVPINFYSALLGRQGVYTVAWDGTDADQVIARDIETLAQYTIASLKDYGRAYRKASSSS